MNFVELVCCNQLPNYTKDGKFKNALRLPSICLFTFCGYQAHRPIRPVSRFRLAAQTFMTSLHQRTVSGLGWNAATQMLAKALQFVAMIMLARLLNPSEFGFVGMILVFTGLASSIADMGLGASIVQKQALSDADLDSVFWLSLAIGCALMIIFSFAAPLLASFYDEPRLRLMTVAVASNFILGSLNVVQYALLQKSLDFRSRFWIETVAISGSGIIALALALAGAGVWSLIAQSLWENAIRSAAVWYLSPWRPRCRFDPGAVKELLRFGRHLVGFNIVVYCAQNFDKLAIGQQIGSSALGIYSLSDRLMRMPLANVTAITGAVMFPALSQLQDSIETMKRAYLRANRVIALLTFPMMLGLSTLAEPAILVIYGDKWQGAVRIMQPLCFAGLAQSVYNTASWIFLSCGRPDILFRLGVLSMVVRIAGVLIGMHWGLLGVAWAYVLGGYLFLLYPTWSLAGRLIGLRFADLLKNVSGPFYCAAFMAAVIWLSDRWLFIEEAHWTRLLLNTLAGIAIYGFLIMRFNLEAWQDVRVLILETGGRRSRLIRFMLGSGSQVGRK
jgi:O-antigen/teichoic acid export membrane protein